MEKVNKKKSNKNAESKNKMNDLIDELLRLTSQTSVNNKCDLILHNKINQLLNEISKMERQDLTPNDSREENFESLTNWVKSNGGITDNVSIERFDGMEFGLKANADLMEGDLICAIPKKIMMTLENIKESPLKYLYENDPIMKNMGNVALALFLILEYLKKKSSFWYPYISSLPVKYTTILYFTDSDFLHLKYSPAFESAVRFHQCIARQFAYFKKVFQSSDDKASLLLRNKFSYQLYRWAVSTVMTRQNYVVKRDGKDINALIPFWDMCNHANGYLTTEYKRDAERCECFAFKNFHKGNQVFIFYGARSNADFLIHNGFVCNDNEHDSYRLRLGISKSDPLHDLRINLLNRLEMNAVEDFYIRCQPEPVDGKLLAFLRIFNMDKENLIHWLENEERTSDLSCMDCALDTQVEDKTWKFLATRLDLLFKGYPKTIENGDEMDDWTKTLTLLEKNILGSTLEYVRRRVKT